MSKEILVNFDTILWTSISWEKMYLYITKLKSRIYKASNKKSYSKKCFLQASLISSPAAKIIALCMTNKEYQENYFNQISNAEQMYLIQTLEISSLQSVHLHSLNQKNINKKEAILHLEIIVSNLIMFALEPEFNAVEDQNHNFSSIQSPKNLLPMMQNYVLQQITEKYYVYHLSLVNFLTCLSTESLMLKLNISGLLSKVIKKK
jgi:hypothetical protein